MDRKLKCAAIAVLMFCAWFLLPAAPGPVGENMAAQAVSPLWDGSIATGFAGGTGTQADPYLISTGAQLAYFAQQVNSGITYAGKYIKLTQDILLNEMDGDGSFVSAAPREFTCIGNNGNTTGNNGGFMGVFDGNSKKITGLYINQPGLDNQGLFGFANDNSTIKNVGVSGSVTGRENVGGVVGRTRGVVQMCYNKCTVTGKTNVGGIAGNSDQHSVVKNCYNTGAVKGGANVGGVAGVIDKKTVMVHNNYSSGTVEGETNAGGVAGYNFGGTVWHNYYDSENFTGGGINGNDVLPDDGAVGYPGSEMQDMQVVDLLNSKNSDGAVWTLDAVGVNNGYPVLGLFIPISVTSFKAAEGKRYTAGDLTPGAPLTVTADSAFTVNFTVLYVLNCNMAAQTIRLVKNGTAAQLPAGTSIIMLAGGSYYYINLATAASAVSLGEFIKMGSVSAHFAPPAEAHLLDVKDYLFVFDFTKTASPIAAGTYRVELLSYGGISAGIMPAVTITGQNTYSLTASVAGDRLDVNLSRAPAAGYDYKTAGKSYAYEIYLERGGIRAPWPAGTRINGTLVAGTLPYVFTAAAPGRASIPIDMSGCVNPPAPGGYTAVVNAYACPDAAAPRGGCLLASATAPFAVAAPAQYAIRASVATRVFDQTAQDIPVAFEIETLGTGIVKYTLQRKYGTSYVDINGRTDLPVSMSGGGAVLTIPAGSETGTYRFVLTLYDGNGTARARAVESVIVK